MAVTVGTATRSTRIELLTNRSVITLKLFQALELFHFALVQFKTCPMGFLGHPHQWRVGQCPRLTIVQLPAPANVCVAAWKPDLVDVLVVFVVAGFLSGDVDGEYV
jgi:hypothetical protein